MTDIHGRQDMSFAILTAALVALVSCRTTEVALQAAAPAQEERELSEVPIEDPQDLETCRTVRDEIERRVRGLLP